MVMTALATLSAASFSASAQSLTVSDSVTLTGTTIYGDSTQSGTLTITPTGTVNVEGESADGLGVIIIGNGNGNQPASPTADFVNNGTLILTPSTDGSNSNASLWIGNGLDDADPATGTVTTSGTIMVADTNKDSGSYASIDAGWGVGSTAVFNQTGGLISMSAGALNVGIGASTATWTMSNNSVLQLGTGSTVYVGEGLIENTGTFGGNGVLNITDNSTVTATGNYTQWFVGSGSATIGTINQSGNSSVTINESDGVLLFGANAQIGTPYADGPGGTGIYNLSSGSLTVEGSLYKFAFGEDAGTTGQLNQTGGTITVVGNNVIFGDSGSGTYTLSSGTGTFHDGITLGAQAGGNGVINLNGGELQIGGANGIAVGAGTSTVNFNGGTLQVIDSDFSTSVAINLGTNTESTVNTNGFNATFNGSFNGMDGILLKTGSGTMTLAGANNTIGTFAVLNGSVAQGAGSNLSSWYLVVGDEPGSNASYTISGGSITLPSGTPPSIITGGASASSFEIGVFGGTGTVTQTGGSVLVQGGSFNIGNGSYNLSAGTFEADGGSYGTSLSNVGYENGNGAINLSGTATMTFSGAESELILSDRHSGDTGNGTLTQTGGVLAFTNGAQLFLTGNGQGTYNLDGGTLEVGGQGLQGNYGTGTYAFNLGGGTIQVTGSDLATSVNASLTPSTFSTIDTNGLNATFNGNFTGMTGGLEKIGSGTMTLAGANNMIGTFAVLAGTAAQGAGSGLTTWDLVVGSVSGSANYTISGGSITLPSGTPPSYITGGASASSFEVGVFGATGTVTQTGGSVLVQGGSFNIGKGSYNISGGSFEADGGSYGTSLSNVGYENGTGTINLSGTGTITYNGAESELILSDRHSGDTGNGTLNQTGGVLDITNGAQLFLTGNGQGTYNLDGGTLEVGGSGLQGVYNTDVGTYQFNLGGGTIEVTGSNLVTSVNASLVGSTTSVVNTNGLNAEFDGNFTGLTGGLEKTGSGTMTLGGANNQIGALTAVNGTVSQGAGSGLTAWDLTVGVGAGSSANYTISGGSITLLGGAPPSAIGGSASSFEVGVFGGTGTVTQTGGSVLVQGGSFNIGTGAYNISGGSFEDDSDGGTSLSNVGYENGTGTINLSGTGTITFNGAESELILSDRHSGDTGNGTLNQTGGVLDITNGAQLFLTGNGQGTYNLDGGTLEVGGSGLQGVYNTDVGTYQFNLGGGTIEVTGSNLVTSVNASLVGSTTSVVNTNGLNAEFDGNFTGLTGGLEKTGSGTMTLGGANNQIGALTAVNGTVSQGAGSGLTAWDLTVGVGAGSSANYTISGGSITLLGGAPPSAIGGSASSFEVGVFGGTGTVTQTGGSVLVQGGSFNIGTGAYNISGGSFEDDSDGGTSLSNVGYENGTGTINLSGTGTITYNGAESELILSDRHSGDTGNGTLNQTGGVLDITNGAQLFLTGNGQGTYNLDGGTLEVGGSGLQGVYNTDVGTYQFNLGGGTIEVTGSNLVTSVNASLVGSTTSVVNTNGLNAEFDGNFTGLTGGLEKTGSGTMTLGGANNQIGALTAVNGTVSQGAGSGLTAWDLTVGVGAGSSANYTISGGSITLLGGAPPSAIGGSASSFEVGVFGGTGTVTQTGGSILVQGGSFNIGTGAYNISGGSFEDDSDGGTSLSNVGYENGTGTINLSGTGTITYNGAESELILSDRHSGDTGNGTLNQTGGVLDITNGAQLFLTGNGQGTYNLDGGTLEVGGSGLQGVYNTDIGTYQFNLGGGTIQVTDSDLTTSINANFTANTTSTIDTNGHNATWSGSFSGSGSFDKIGSGTFTAVGSNPSYSGNVSVQKGAFMVNNGGAAGGQTFAMNSLSELSGATVGGVGSITAVTLTLNGLVQVGSGANATDTLAFNNSSTATLNDADLEFFIASTDEASKLMFGTGTVDFVGATVTLLEDINGIYTLVQNANASTNDYTGLTYGGKDGNGNKIITGGLTLTGSAAGSGSYLFVDANGDIGAVVAPEPGTNAMILSGLVLLATLRYWRSRRNRL